MKSWEREEASHFAVMGDFFRLARGEDAGLDAALRDELERYMRVRLSRGKWLPADVTRLHSEWYREFYRVLGVRDPYRERKQRSERLARRLLAEREPADLGEALVAAVVANRLDFGAPRPREGAGELPLERADLGDLSPGRLWLDDGPELLARIDRARHLLLLADNCGESAFDEALLRRVRERNPRCRLSVAGKSSPMLNDVTAAELRAQGMGRLARVISTGSNAFGVPEEEASPEFARAFAGADLVIAKGQAHLEYWIHFGERRLFHLLHTKFAIADPGLGTLPPGVDLVLSAERYAAGKPRWRPRALDEGGAAARPEGPGDG